MGSGLSLSCAYVHLCLLLEQQLEYVHVQVSSRSPWTFIFETVWKVVRSTSKQHPQWYRYMVMAMYASAGQSFRSISCTFEQLHTQHTGTSGVPQQHDGWGSGKASRMCC